VGALVVRLALGDHPLGGFWSITAFKQPGARHEGVAAIG
jgi:hypothetical protein